MQGIKKHNPRTYTTFLQTFHLIYNHREKLVLKEKNEAVLLRLHQGKLPIIDGKSIAYPQPIHVINNKCIS
ncbi:hypothetical protein OIU79_016226 [Salix purpurea]|uniref:Uncharacterized protein n=1 Tax=Salix purpurea TaxID=77065 RepID=A0A9Q0SR51_SALPP|nr:hypothetical protein OIU79_016226 [Salix purpurea]